MNKLSLTRKNCYLKAVLTILLTIPITVAFLFVLRRTLNRPLLMIYRMTLVALVYAFGLAHIYIKIEALYDFIFKKRYLLGFITFVVLVAAKINFSSIGMFDTYVQPGEGNDFISTVFGSPRAIRSDEWAVSTMRTLTYQYSSGAYNEIIAAFSTPNLSASGVQWCLGMLASPFKLGYFISADFGMSFCWCGQLITTVLVTFEFFLIITKKKKLLSLFGVALTVFSGFFMWWSYVMPFTYGIAAVVCIWYYLDTDNKLKRILFGIGVAVFGASFVCVFYPAWQVPFGYLYLCVIIWVFVCKWEKIKKYRFSDWAIFAAVVVFAVGIIVSNIITQMDYLTAISATVYPGKRFETGGNAIYKLFFTPINFKFPFNDTEISTSENGIMYTLFPLPIVTAVYVLIKKKFKDLLLLLTLITSIFLGIYCTVGVPEVIAKISLLSYSTAWRAVDGLALSLVVMLIKSLSEMEENGWYFRLSGSVMIAIAVTLLTVWCCNKYYGSYFGKIWIAVTAIIMIALITVIVSEFIRIKYAVIVFTTVICMVTGMCVNPINVGTNVIYSKPAAKAIQSIVESDSDAIWVSVDQSFVEANFCAACGAKTLNSNNYMPNIEMWETIFENGENEEIYNRYANLTVSVTSDENKLEEITPDLLNLSLNSEMLKKLNIKYLYSNREINELDVTLLYNQSGKYIYELNYQE